MKPEPAKNQKDFSGSTKVEPLKDKVCASKDLQFFWKKDIKNAVEWLCNELNQMYKNRSQKEPYTHHKVKEKVDEAFEDVK